ncbi:type I-E CRISPR-associated protein Cse2/CasB [Amorphus sp. 3PC139-8]|uniref:type I-E CRISPR-associated protein Cse2/CasB n=1 Tax=Amorphus sp. 3PC139-8 TaxID=2735676 RepID=UPI00345CAE76
MTDRSEIAEEISSWRFQLGYGSRADRGALARLRRLPLAETDAGLLPDCGYAATLSSYRSLRARAIRVISKAPPHHQASWMTDFARATGWFDERLVIVAVTLAYIKDDPGGSLGRALGRGSAFGPHALRQSPLLAERRLTHLLRLRTPAERLNAGRRIVRLLKGSAPVKDLARLLLFGDERERWRLVSAYYNLPGPIAPDESEIDTNPAQEHAS